MTFTDEAIFDFVGSFLSDRLHIAQKTIVGIWKLIKASDSHVHQTHHVYFIQDWAQWKSATTEHTSKWSPRTRFVLSLGRESANKVATGEVRGEKLI